jgi:hypothetical protein
MQVLHEVLWGLSQSNQEVIEHVVRNEEYVLLLLREVQVTQMSGGEYCTWNLKDSLSQRELEGLQGLILFFEVKLYRLGFGKLELLIWHRKRGERNRVLEVVQVVQSAFNIFFQEVGKVAFGCVLNKARLLGFLVLLDQNDGSNIVGNSLNLGDSTVGLLNKVEVLVYIFELRAYNRELCYR